MPQQVSFGQIIERHPRERNSGDLCARLLPATRFHGTFRVLEVHDHFELTDALELHVIELPKLGRQTDEPQLARWVRFFLAQSEAELQELAMSDVDMQRAKDENINPADGTTFWHGGPCPALIRSVDLRSAGSTRALSGMTAHEQRVPSCPIAISRGALRPKGARGADRVR